MTIKYGDSFYLVDSDVFRSNYKEMLQAFTNVYPDTRILQKKKAGKRL